MITEVKRVERLGATMPIPVEVSPFGLRHVERHLHELGAETTLRLGHDGIPFVTDGGHRIIDCRFAAIDDPEALALELKRIVGVFETGLFIGLCDHLIVGTEQGIEQLDRA